MDTPFHTVGFSSPLSCPSEGRRGRPQGLCSRPRRVSGHPGWGGAALQAGRQGHTTLTTRGQRRPGLKGWGGWATGLNQCIGPDRPGPWSPGLEALPRRPPQLVLRQRSLPLPFASLLAPVGFEVC